MQIFTQVLERMNLDRMTVARVARQTLLLTALCLGLAAPVHAAAPSPTAPRTEVEAAAQELVAPIQRRLTVRNDSGGYDVWLLTALNFEKATEAVRVAISSKRLFSNKFKMERWTYLEPDRSYLIDVSGGSRPYRLRLTRHMTGSLIEVQDAGEAADAPLWTPTYRAQPVLLPHGAIGR